MWTLFFFFFFDIILKNLYYATITSFFEVPLLFLCLFFESFLFCFQYGVLGFVLILLFLSLCFTLLFILFSFFFFFFCLICFGFVLYRKGLLLFLSLYVVLNYLKNSIFFIIWLEEHERVWMLTSIIISLYWFWCWVSPTYEYSLVRKVIDHDQKRQM